MKIDLSPGDTYVIPEASACHVLEVHYACDHRCFDLRAGTVVIVASEPFQPIIPASEHSDQDAGDFDDYWEIFAVGPHGLTILSLPYE